MTRRDIIIIAVLANIGVLALLFMLAFREDVDKAPESNPEIAYSLVQENPQPTPATPTTHAEPSEISDDLDAPLEDATAPVAAQSDEDSVQFNEAEPTPPPPPKPDVVPPVQKPTETPPGKVVEVTVKKGDALEKIARANGTTVEAIIKLNNLKNDKLKIGQVIKVPANSKTAKPAAAAASTAQSKPIATAEAQYYTVKAGDNPWKIAKQFHIKIDQFLKLNNLDDESARNLKVGDKVRVQ